MSEDTNEFYGVLDLIMKALMDGGVDDPEVEGNPNTGEITVRYARMEGEQ